MADRRAAPIAKFERRELLLPPPTWTTIRQLEKLASIDDVFAWARARKIVRVMPGFIKTAPTTMLTLPGDPLFPTIPDWEVPEETRFVLEEGARWQPLEGLTAAIDRVIELFNAKAMDLPDGFFDRRTQFVLNGAPFETLLGQPPNDPLVLMLARGPAGFRFTAKALQHAMPDARLQALSTRDSHVDSASLKTGLSTPRLDGRVHGDHEVVVVRNLARDRRDAQYRR